MKKGRRQEHVLHALLLLKKDINPNNKLLSSDRILTAILLTQYH